MEGRKKDSFAYVVRLAAVIAELLVITAAFYFLWRDLYPPTVFPPFEYRGKFVLMGTYALLSYIFFLYNGGMKFGYLKASDIVVSQCASMFVVNLITFLQLSLIANRLIGIGPMCLIFLADIAVIVLCVYVFTFSYHHFFRPEDAVMIYGSRNVLALKAKMDKKPDRYRIKETLSSDTGIAEIEQRITGYAVVIIADVPAQLRNDILKFCYNRGIDTYVTPKLSDVIMSGAEKIHLFDTPLMRVSGDGLKPSQRFFKRIMDIVLCLIALVVLSPLMIGVALAIKKEDGGPVFFRQTRVTFDERRFDIIKFRSMIVGAEEQGVPVPATDGDSRITKTGRFIRRTRIDELPQIFNILRGDMSIVGPRPERVEHVQKYSAMIPEFRFRSRVRAGLTGYAQIFGKYNTTAYDKLKLDLMYIENYSFLLDMKIIAMTVSALIKKDSTEGFDHK